MIDPSASVRRAVFAQLSGDASLAALGNPALGSRIYDAAPQRAEYPFVAMPMASVVPALETDGSGGAEVMLQVTVSSRSGGGLEAQQIAARIVELLHDTDLTTDTGTFVMGRLQLSSVQRERDGETWHAVQRFIFIIDEAGG
ncbi:MAG: DUF3168 domain-containing protein [Pseudomonadota bacterium]